LNTENTDLSPKYFSILQTRNFFSSWQNFPHRRGAEIAECSRRAPKALFLKKTLKQSRQNGPNKSFISEFFSEIPKGRRLQRIAERILSALCVLGVFAVKSFGCGFAALCLCALALNAI
jgi:hypothetical protein